MMVMVYDIQLANHTCSNMIEKYIILVDGLKTLWIVDFIAFTYSVLPRNFSYFV